MQQNTKKYWRTDKLGLFDDTGFANNATILLNFLKMKCLLKCLLSWSALQFKLLNIFW